MAREFKGKLTAEDVAWLRARRPLSQVEQMIDLHGVEKGGDSEKAAAKAAAKAQEEAEKAALAAEEAAREAEAQAAAAAAAESTQSDQEAASAVEDLIGVEAFDVLGSTEAEVKAWAETASDEAKAAALATEQGREDRDARKGVVTILS